MLMVVYVFVYVCYKELHVMYPYLHMKMDYKTRVP